MTRRVLEKLCTKKVCVDFLAPSVAIKEAIAQRRDFIHHRRCREKLPRTLEPSPAPVVYIIVGPMAGVEAENSAVSLLQGEPGSVRFGCGLGMERFERFRFSVPAVPLRRVFLCVSVQFSREDGSGFGSWKTVPAVPVPRSVPGKTVPTVPVSGSGSVPGPPCFEKNQYNHCNKIQSSNFQPSFL